MSGLFITGVGTGVGKTLVTTILCHQLRSLGRPVVALKPVVSGFVPGDPESDPALILRSLGADPTDDAVAAIAPWRFAAPIAPHLAARREGRSITLDQMVRFCQQTRGGPGSIRLVEGAGGVMSPVCEGATVLDGIALLGDPAVLVTGSYLGALSHTLTALVALRSRSVPVRAVVVSESADSVGLDETIAALREFGADEIPIHRLPRQSDRWRSAPDLTPICEAGHD